MNFVFGLTRSTAMPRCLVAEEIRTGSILSRITTLEATKSRKGTPRFGCLCGSVSISKTDPLSTSIPHQTGGMRSGTVSGNNCLHYGRLLHSHSPTLAESELTVRQEACTAHCRSFYRPWKRLASPWRTSSGRRAMNNFESLPLSSI